MSQVLRKSPVSIVTWHPTPRTGRKCRQIINKSSRIISRDAVMLAQSRLMQVLWPLILGSIQTDDGSFASSIDSFNPALQQVQSDIGTVQTGLQTLENDAAVVDISVATSESGAQAALQSAEQQVTTSDQVLQSAQAQVKQYDQETAEMNTNAQNLANGMHC